MILLIRYFVSSLNFDFFLQEDKECKGKESVKRERLCDEREDEREDESHDEDEVWDQMEVVKTKSKSKEHVI